MSSNYYNTNLETKKEAAPEQYSTNSKSNRVAAREQYNTNPGRKKHPLMSNNIVNYEGKKAASCAYCRICYSAAPG